MELYEKTIDSKKIFDGKIIKLKVDTVLLPDGKKSTREIVNHPGAVAILPLTDKNELIMVKQYRKPIERVLLEVPAGKLDEDELPEECAERELEEETGLTAEKLINLSSIYTTPGFSDEVIHLFIATGLKKGRANSDDDEFLEVVKIPFNKVMEMIEQNLIMDSKTINCILLARHYLPGNNF
ncbi:MAG: NUDIX hydrolase [Clostridia bacterium]|nr:NUDIX hydrolase [Clostridia bacterium]